MTTVLTNYDALKAALAATVEFDEVKAIRDRAEALRVYTQQIGESPALQNQIAEIRIRAERRAGELLREMPKRKGAAGGRDARSSSTTTLEDLGISKDQSSRYQKLAAIPEDDFEQRLEASKQAGRQLTTAAILEGDVRPGQDDESATRAWGRVFGDIAALCQSVEKVGGIAALAEDWTDEQVETALHHIGGMMRSLSGWRNELEGLRG